MKKVKAAIGNKIGIENPYIKVTKMVVIIEASFDEIKCSGPWYKLTYCEGVRHLVVFAFLQQQ